MYTSHVTNRNIYQLPSSDFNNESQMRAFISSSMEKNLLLSVERMSQAMVGTVLSGLVAGSAAGSLLKSLWED